MAESLEQRVTALAEIGRVADAAKAARDGLATEPDNAELHRLLAICLSETGDHAGATAAGERAVALRPDDADSHKALGIAVYRTGRHEEASEHFGRAIALRPNDYRNHTWQAEALLKQVTSRFRPAITRSSTVVDRAEHHANEAVRLRPDRPEGHVMLGKVEIIRKNSFAATAHARRALAIDPNNAVAHQVLGLGAQLTGDTKAASDHFVTAGRINPSSRGNLALLKGLRGGLPIGGIALFFIARIVVKAGGALGGVVLAIVVLAVFVAAVVLWPRWKARRDMSPEARAVLDRDRKMRRAR